MMLPLLTLAAPKVDVWPFLGIEKGEILVRADARVGRDKPVKADFSRIVVRVVGPQGVEATRLGPAQSDSGRPARSLRVVRSPEAGWREATIDVRPAFPKGRFPTGSTAKLRYYLPAKDPAEADRQLRAQLLGKPVWVRGAAAVPDGFAAQDSSLDQVGWDPGLPATVVGIQRLTRPLRQISSTDAWDQLANWGGTDFYASNPLAIRLRLPMQRRFRLTGRIGGEMGWKPDPTLSGVAEATVYLADTWHASRLFAPSPEAILAQETPEIQNAFARRTLALGMPRSLVALLLGDPDVAASRAEVWSRRVWSYAGGLDSYTVGFDAQGRVSGFGLQMFKLP